LKNSNICDHNSPTSLTDRRTDRQTTCDRNNALCTKVHRAVKKNVKKYVHNIVEYNSPAEMFRFCDIYRQACNFPGRPRRSDHLAVHLCLFSFYRGMHCAKRGLAIACRLSVCPSVTLVNCDHIGWNSSKIISQLVSLGSSLSADPNIGALLQGEHPEIFRPK